MKFEEFESIIIRDIIEQYPQYKQKLLAQFESVTVQKRERFASGFYTDYAVGATDQTLGEGVDLQLGENQWNINDLECGSDYILWIENGLIHSLEGFSYQEPWPDEILWCEKMSYSIVSMQFCGVGQLEDDLMSSPRKACIPAAREGVYNTPSCLVYEAKQSVEDEVYNMCRTYEKVIAQTKAQGGRVHLYITQHPKDASELVLPDRLLQFLAEQEIFLSVNKGKAN